MSRAYYNASVIAYDPYCQTSEVITFPGITGSPDYTIAGIDYNGKDSMYFSALASTSFQETTTGNASFANFSGPNSVIRYDTKTKNITWISDIVPVRQAIFNSTGKLFTGFSDVAEDRQGNAYAIGSFPSIIVKITPDGTPSVWWQPETQSNNETLTSAGIFVSGNTIVINDRSSTPGLHTFDITASNPSPVYLLPNGFPTNFSGGADAMIAPSKYGGQVALWSDDFFGQRVIATRDGWKTADYLGLVPMDPGLRKLNGYNTDAFAMGNTIYALTDFFQIPDEPIKSQQDWLMVDITEQVDVLVRAWEGST